jgi:hypothetical protein
MMLWQTKNAPSSLDLLRMGHDSKSSHHGLIRLEEYLQCEFGVEWLAGSDGGVAEKRSNR